MKSYLRGRHGFAIAALLLAAPLGNAEMFSFQGTFLSDTDVQLFAFAVTSPMANVALRTWSYAGGTDANGDMISAGGFAPQLSVFAGADATAILMNPGIPGLCGSPAGMDPNTGDCDDIYYPTTAAFPGGVWAAGNYLVALTEAGNPAIGGTLGDGFQEPGPGNYTCQAQASPAAFPVDGPFCDPDPAATALRTGNWELDITGDVATANPLPVTGTPEPNTVILLLPCALALMFRRR